MDNKRYEILEHLPPYGPMYIPVTGDDEPFFSEGFVIRFFKNDGTDWVANFMPGWTQCSFVKDYPNSNIIVVIAKGMGYIMNPEEFKPIQTFGITVKDVIELENGDLLVADDIYLEIIGGSGIKWKSPRISWDGFAELKIEKNILTGLSYDPMNDIDEWTPFEVNLQTKKIEGGSYRKYYKDEEQQKGLKPWWKFWN